MLSAPASTTRWPRAAPVVAALLALAAVVALLLPSAHALDHPAGLGVAVLAAALAALCVGRPAHVVGPRAVVRTTARDRSAPLTSARVTDPTHHPLRPRAPGTA